MNYNGLPDNHKPSTRGRAPDVESNNIFGGYPQETENINHDVEHFKSHKTEPKSSMQNRQMYEDKCNEAFANRNRQNQQQSNIFGDTTPQDFHRDPTYGNNNDQHHHQQHHQQQHPQQHQQQHQQSNNYQDQQTRPLQNNQNRNESMVFNEQRLTSAPRCKQQQKRQGYNPITGNPFIKINPWEEVN